MVFTYPNFKCLETSLVWIWQYINKVLSDLIKQKTSRMLEAFQVSPAPHVCRSQSQSLTVHSAAPNSIFFFGQNGSHDMLQIREWPGQTTDHLSMLWNNVVDHQVIFEQTGETLLQGTLLLKDPCTLVQVGELCSYLRQYRALVWYIPVQRELCTHENLGNSHRDYLW